MTTNFEAKLHGFRRTQDGVVVSYVVHPNDVSTELATAALGTRYMVAVAEIGDDERPIDGSPHSSPINGTKDEAKLTTAPANDGIAGSPLKDRRPFASLPLSQQAAIRCRDKDFATFLLSKFSNAFHKFDGDVPAVVRKLVGVGSRSEIVAGTSAAHYWDTLERGFQSWLTDQRYAGVRR